MVIAFNIGKIVNQTKIFFIFNDYIFLIEKINNNIFFLKYYFIYYIFLLFPGKAKRRI